MARFLLVLLAFVASAVAFVPAPVAQTRSSTIVGLFGFGSAGDKPKEDPKNPFAKVQAQAAARRGGPQAKTAKPKEKKLNKQQQKLFKNLNDRQNSAIILGDDGPKNFWK